MLLLQHYIKLSIQWNFKAWGKKIKFAMLDISDTERRLFYNLIKVFWI